MLTLEDAHWRLERAARVCARASAIAAVLREGCAADIVVYDYDSLRCGRSKSRTTCRAANGAACSKADGYRYIMVNGEITMRDGEQTGASAGRLLRHGKA